MHRIDELNKRWRQKATSISSKPEEISRSEAQESSDKQPSPCDENTREPSPCDENTREPSPCADKQPSPCAPQPSLFKSFLSLLLQVGSIIVILLILVTFLFGLIQYSEPSMAPAIKDGDLVLFYRYNGAGYLPQDVIVLEHDGQKQIRRVIATAGDTVDITEEGLVINGALQQEPEIYQKTERYQDGASFPLTVPEGHVFVLGDNRENTTDSRIYGCVKVKNTLGKVMTVVLRRSI